MDINKALIVVITNPLLSVLAIFACEYVWEYERIKQIVEYFIVRRLIIFTFYHMFLKRGN
jgi:hypothetical protein